MCDDCGCGDTDKVSVEIHESLLAGNAAQAAHNREHFTARGMLALNLMGSPGSGKTALLEATARALAAAPGGGSRHRLAALSGDLATDHDGARLRAAGSRPPPSPPDRPAISTPNSSIRLSTTSTSATPTRW